MHDNSATAPFFIGSYQGACGDQGPLVIGGNLQVYNNAAEIIMRAIMPVKNPFCPIRSAGTSACGNIEVHNNTGGGVLERNAAGGNCQLYNDTPPFTFGDNTAGKNNDCISPN